MSCCDILSGPVSSAALFLASLLLFLLQHGGLPGGSAEAPPRSQEQVLLDLSKVALGAVWAGAMTSACCASMLGSIEPAGDECGWYAVEIMLDTSLGMYASLWILRIAVWLIKKVISERKAQQVCAGKYRSKTGAFVKVVYAQQVMLWVLVISVSKLGVAALVLSQAFQLQVLARFFLARAFGVPVLGYLLMAAFRVLMQAVQFWLAERIFVRARAFAEGDPFDLEAGASGSLFAFEDGGYVPPEAPKVDLEAALAAPDGPRGAAVPRDPLGELISRLEADPGYLEEALQGLLPEPHPGNELPSWGDFARDVGSEGFADSCQICFLQGWEDESNDAVDPVGLFPAVRELMQSKELAVTLPQYSALFGFFDRDGVGSVSQTTFPDFVRYVAVMAYLGACRESGSGRPVDDAGAEDAEEQPCEEEVQRRLDETRAELEALGASALEPDATGAGGIDEERLKVQMDEELLARKRQELEELRARARAEEDALVAAQRPSGRGEVRHYEQDRAGAPGPQRKKGCLPACGRKQ
ncbi:unnamed protein product [Prorocentrum cordatum]|uniref:Calmodulin n=1 Tax=Prorocentrum cordatum TaxID=2364126 RepID=A0ABN9QYY4_9DINO|nr:unnamed protein product [Polarella glacialis]